MLLVNEAELERMEAERPGIRAQIRRFEEKVVPTCSLCGSCETASVFVGIIGRTIAIAGATTKARLIPNGPAPAPYFCWACSSYF
jgi:hypothetical protein